MLYKDPLLKTYKKETTEWYGIWISDIMRLSGVHAIFVPGVSFQAFHKYASLII